MAIIMITALVQQEKRDHLAVLKRNLRWAKRHNVEHYNYLKRIWGHMAKMKLERIPRHKL